VSREEEETLLVIQVDFKRCMLFAYPGPLPTSLRHQNESLFKALKALRENP
jgi:hypothetical protein